MTLDDLRLELSPELDFIGDGVDYFDYRLTVETEKGRESVTMVRHEVEELIDGLMDLAIKIKKQLGVI